MVLKVIAHRTSYYIAMRNKQKRSYAPIPTLIIHNNDRYKRNAPNKKIKNSAYRFIRIPPKRHYIHHFTNTAQDYHVARSNSKLHMYAELFTGETEPLAREAHLSFLLSLAHVHAYTYTIYTCKTTCTYTRTSSINKRAHITEFHAPVAGRYTRASDSRDARVAFTIERRSSASMHAYSIVA